jgi:hypothetical protein
VTRIKVGLWAGVLTLAALGAGLVVGHVQSAPADRVCFEAENAKTVTEHFKKQTEPFRDTRNRFSSGGYIEIPQDANGPEKKEVYDGVVTYEVNLPSAGEYYFWARTYWRDRDSNSLGVSFNSGDPQVLGDDGIYLVWQWRKLRNRVNLPQGKLNLAFKNREDGIMIDQIFLTKSSVVPVGRMAATPGALVQPEPDDKSTATR